MQNPITAISDYIHGTKVMQGAYPEGTPVDTRGNVVRAAAPQGDPNFKHEKRNGKQMRAEATDFEKRAAAQRDFIYLNSTKSEAEDGTPTRVPHPGVDQAALDAAQAESDRLLGLASQTRSDAALYNGLTTVAVGGSLLLVGAGVALGVLA